MLLFIASICCHLHAVYDHHQNRLMLYNGDRLILEDLPVYEYAGQAGTETAINQPGNKTNDITFQTRTNQRRDTVQYNRNPPYDKSWNDQGNVVAVMDEETTNKIIVQDLLNFDKVEPPPVPPPIPIFNNDGSFKSDSSRSGGSKSERDKKTDKKDLKDKDRDRDKGNNRKSSDSGGSDD